MIVDRGMTFHIEPMMRWFEAGRRAPHQGTGKLPSRRGLCTIREHTFLFTGNRLLFEASLPSRTKEVQDSCAIRPFPFRSILRRFRHPLRIAPRVRSVPSSSSGTDSSSRKRRRKSDPRAQERETERERSACRSPPRNGLRSLVGRISPSGPHFVFSIFVFFCFGFEGGGLRTDWRQRERARDGMDASEEDPSRGSWETCKENVRPLKVGRKVEDLESVLNEGRKEGRETKKR